MRGSKSKIMGGCQENTVLVQAPIEIAWVIGNRNEGWRQRKQRSRAAGRC